MAFGIATAPFGNVPGQRQGAIRERSWPAALHHSGTPVARAQLGSVLAHRQFAGASLAKIKAQIQSVTCHCQHVIRERPWPPQRRNLGAPIVTTMRGSETFLAIAQAHSEQTLAIARVLFGIVTCHCHCIIRGRLWPPSGRNPGSFLATCVAPFRDAPGHSEASLAIGSTPVVGIPGSRRYVIYDRSGAPGRRQSATRERSWPPPRRYSGAAPAILQNVANRNGSYNASWNSRPTKMIRSVAKRSDVPLKGWSGRSALM